MRKFNKNKEYYLHEENYDNYPLIDFSIETFKHFDECGITFDSKTIIKFDFEFYDEDEMRHNSKFTRGFDNELNSLLNVLDVDSKFSKKKRL